MVKFFVIAVSFLNTFSNSVDSDTLYHQYEVSKYSWYITNWNLDKEKLPIKYVEEISDEYGRVIQLSFFENGELTNPYLCTFDPIITFEYPNDSTIITTQWKEKNIWGGAHLECADSPTRHVYTYDPESKFLTTFHAEPLLNNEVKSYWQDTLGFSEQELSSLVENHTIYSDNPTYITWYLYSFNKLSGVFPIQKEANIDIVLNTGSESTFLTMKKRVLETLPTKFVH